MLNFVFFGAGGQKRGAPKRPRMPGRKGNTEKGKERGQASEMLRSPLLVTWKCVQARSAKVHACGAQLKTRISRNFGEGRESAMEIPRKKNSLPAALAAIPHNVSPSSPLVLESGRLRLRHEVGKWLKSRLDPIRLRRFMTETNFQLFSWLYITLYYFCYLLFRFIVPKSALASKWRDILTQNILHSNPAVYIRWRFA